MKRKLKICIDLPGNINHGLWSPERGESRWAQNLAQGLAERGHEVIGYSYMYGGPKWGLQPPVPNVRLIHYQQIKQFGQFDIFIDNCYWQGKPLVADAKLTIIGKYGYEEWTKNLPDNFLVASPYKASWLNEHSKAKWLPAPYWKDLGYSKFTNQCITIPSRDVCRKEETAANAAIILDTLKELESQFDLKGFHFLCANYNGKGFISGEPKDGEHEVRQKYNILGRARNLESAFFYPLIPWNQVLDIFRHKTKINLPFLNPSNVIDAAMSGVVSILWDNGGYEWLFGVGEASNTKLNYGDSQEQIKNVLIPLLKDEAVYTKALEVQQEAIKDLQWDSALDIWEKEVIERL